MLDKFKEHVEEHFGDLTQKELYLACSGGKDSMVLLHLLMAISLKPTLLHCNFQLRGTESDLDADFVQEFTERHRLTCFIETFDTSEILKTSGLSLQETARNLRYDWFNQFLTTQNHILLTAHHQNDSVETFFINLLRGTGLSGLTGINQKTHQIARPLLIFTRKEIDDYAEKHSINFRQDQSNFKNDYLRNYLRNEIIPSLEIKSPQLVKKMAETMNSLSETADYLRLQSNQFQQQNFKKFHDYETINKNNLLNEHRVLVEFSLKEYGIHRSNYLEFIKTMKAKTGAKFITNSHVFYPDSAQIIITEKLAQSATEIQIDRLPFQADIAGKKYTITQQTTAEPFNTSQLQQIASNKIQFPLTIRPWQKGDRISPLGMEKGSKLISDILINHKIKVYAKPTIHVLQNADGRVISILNLMISEQFKLDHSSERAVLIREG
jgi:tRNA(Ile)-lysidine synthase